MISIDKLLDIIYTEAIESIENQRWENSTHFGKALPSINYRLELIEGKDGCLYWLE